MALGAGGVEGELLAVHGDAGLAGAGAEVGDPRPPGEDVGVGVLHDLGGGTVGVDLFGAGDDHGPGEATVPLVLDALEGAAGGDSGVVADGDGAEELGADGAFGVHGERVGLLRDPLGDAFDHGVDRFG